MGPKDFKMRRQEASRKDKLQVKRQTCKNPWDKFDIT